MAFQQLKKVDKKQKYVVYGWIRSKEKLLRLISVPALVQALCILYFQEYERLDKQFTHPWAKFDDDYKSLTNPLRSFRVNGFGSNICVKGRIYHWRIKIDKTTCLGNICVNIGIIQADKAKASIDDGWWIKDYGYSLFIDNFREVTLWTKGNDGARYGPPCQSGDIIDVWLDLKDDNTLSYGKDDAHYGKAFDIPKDRGYRLALNARDGIMSIVDFDVVYL